MHMITLSLNQLYVDLMNVIIISRRRVQQLSLDFTHFGFVRSFEFRDQHLYSLMYDTLILLRHCLLILFDPGARHPLSCMNTELIMN
jgi:hypothetical protein